MTPPDQLPAAPSCGQVYTDPRDPGAPQDGDLVVVVQDGAPGSPVIGEGYTQLVGKCVRITHTRWIHRHPWKIYLADADRFGSVYAVRWPTEIELAAYQLGAGDQGVQP